MKSTRLFRNFIFLFSLFGLGSFAWAERLENITVEFPNTTLGHAEGFPLDTSGFLSAKEVSIGQGEIVYVVGSASIEKSDISLGTNYFKRNVSLALSVNLEGLDENTTMSIPTTHGIPGPCTVKLKIFPPRVRSSINYSGTNENNGQLSVHGNWEFGSSQGFVSLRIVQGEINTSKKFATVIPENATTNVRVILEQSTDLINWTAASPGVFPPSTAKRFFRVRSEEE